ncbi:hypothetical protein CRG98_037627 [Punica granatum]|uniref:Secreted protein n=1 Tax=Punica granatum TaxID=22663 RepID=A0A2I0IDG0_PUNGR|nr:hypothetical protein CRG98_037627 [Punica granatum]
MSKRSVKLARFCLHAPVRALALARLLLHASLHPSPCAPAIIHPGSSLHACMHMHARPRLGCSLTTSSLAHARHPRAPACARACPRVQPCV